MQQKERVSGLRWRSSSYSPIWRLSKKRKKEKTKIWRIYSNMLAPRKKLWSTPKEAIYEAINLLEPTPDDIIFELGFGDGEFIQQCAALTMDVEEDEILPSGRVVTKTKPIPLVKKIVGVEIEQERVDALTEKLQEQSDEFSSDHVKLICGNALEQDYSEGTCFFFYFIPRGIRLVMPLILAISHPIRLVSFMNPLPDIQPTKVVKVSPPAHPEAQWPLFYYEFDNRPLDWSSRQFKAHSIPLH